MSFEPFRSVRGVAAVMLQPNIDTDVIIRVDHLTKSRADVGAFAFESLRYLIDGSESPNFVLNQDLFRDAPILVTGPNFGCGSSREPAVWAIAGIGIRCLVGTTFGDIFLANCAQNGVLVVTLEADEIAVLGAFAQTAVPVTVDLETQMVEAGPEHRWSFSILPAAKQSLLLGLDDIELAVNDKLLIDEWQRRDKVSRPWVWNVTQHSNLHTVTPS